MNEQQMLLGAIAAEGTVIVAMATYFVHLHSKHSKEKDALTKIVIETTMKMTTAVENNTHSMDRLLNKL